MRKIWLIAAMVVTRTARDRRALVLLLLFPMILIGILGAALQGMIDDGKINPFQIALINLDAPAAIPPMPGSPPMPSFHFGAMLEQDVLGSDEVKRIVRIHETRDLNQAKALMAEGKLAAVIRVPEGFSATVLKGEKAEIELFTDPGRPTQSGIVTQIVGSFSDWLTAGILTARHLGPQAAAALDPSSSMPEVTRIASGTRSVTAKQYYAAAMAVMFTLMTGLSRARDLIAERRAGTLDRVLMTPTAKGTLLAGQILGSVGLVFAQFLILIFGTRFIFGVVWGSLVPVLVLAAAFAVAGSGLGMAAASLLKDEKAADASVGVVGNICAALSGAMFPLYLFPEGLKMVARFIPNYWALQGFLDLMSGLGPMVIALPVSVLLMIGLVSGAVGTWRLAAR